MTSATFSTIERSFLEKVMRKASLPDIYDARDITLVVFRTMRDLMTTEAADRTEAGFADEEIAKLWKDDNPIVSLLSRIRPPLKIDAETFLRRIRQEGGVPRGVTAESVTAAVFSSAKAELHPARVEEIASFLPEGLLELWQQA